MSIRKITAAAVILAATTLAAHQASARIVLNSNSFNGQALNGRFVQGQKLNGRFVQGQKFNGRFVQGRKVNGKKFRGVEEKTLLKMPDTKAGMTLRGLRAENGRLVIELD